jgi:hypothetical protein
MTVTPADRQADRIAARATGIGIGLIVFMLTWTVGVRVTERLWGPPSSAYVAMAVAIVLGAVMAITAGHRLVESQRP